MVTNPIDPFFLAPGPLAQSHPSLFPPPTGDGWLDAFNEGVFLITSSLIPKKKYLYSNLCPELVWFLLVVT